MRGRVSTMLKNWIIPIQPEKEELEERLKEARERLASLQMKLKEHKLPVLILMEGWGAAGKGSLIGKIIKNIDPRFFKVVTMEQSDQEERRYPFLHRYFVEIPEAGKFALYDSGWMNEVCMKRARKEIDSQTYQQRVHCI